MYLFFCPEYSLSSTFQPRCAIQRYVLKLPTIKLQERSLEKNASFVIAPCQPVALPERAAPAACLRTACSPRLPRAVCRRAGAVLHVRHGVRHKVRLQKMLNLLYLFHNPPAAVLLAKCLCTPFCLCELQNK